MLPHAVGRSAVRLPGACCRADCAGSGRLLWRWGLRPRSCGRHSLLYAMACGLPALMLLCRVWVFCRDAPGEDRGLRHGSANPLTCRQLRADLRTLRLPGAGGYGLGNFHYVVARCTCCACCLSGVARPSETGICALCGPALLGAHGEDFGLGAPAAPDQSSGSRSVLHRTLAAGRLGACRLGPIRSRVIIVSLTFMVPLGCAGNLGAVGNAIGRRDARRPDVSAGALGPEPAS